MKLTKKAAVVTAATVVSAGLAVGLAGSAGATGRAPAPAPAFGGSFNCAHGIYAGYCGTQRSGTNLYIAVGRHNAIIGTNRPQASNAEFFWFADASSSATGNDKYAEFAPGGVASNLVMADVGHHQVALVRASGARNQKWIFDGTGWKNVQTNDVLRATFPNGPVTAVPGTSSGPSETWTFVTP
jgi:hypothetical protein